MKLALNGKAHYTDFSAGYELYCNRARKEDKMDFTTYKRVIRKYCKMLANRLEDEGMIDLPNNMGSVSTAIITRKPQYRDGKFAGYGKKDWETGRYDGILKTFGIVFLPVRRNKDNMRCFGFVANRALFKRVKERYQEYDRTWHPVEFKDELI